MTSKEKKTELTKAHGRKEGDTGSSKIQIIVLTECITEFTEYLKADPKDHHSGKGPPMMISQKKSLLDYLKKTDLDGYCAPIEKFGLRK